MRMHCARALPQPRSQHWPYLSDHRLIVDCRAQKGLRHTTLTLILGMASRPMMRSNGSGYSPVQGRRRDHGCETSVRAVARTGMICPPGELLRFIEHRIAYFLRLIPSGRSLAAPEIMGMAAFHQAVTYCLSVAGMRKAIITDCEARICSGHRADVCEPGKAHVSARSAPGAHGW